MRGLSDGILCLAGYAAEITTCAIEKNQRQRVWQFFQCISVGFGFSNNNGCCICGRCKVPDSHFQLTSFVEAEQKIKRGVCLLNLPFHCRSEEVDFCAERDRWKKQCDGKLRRGNNRRAAQSTFWAVLSATLCSFAVPFKTKLTVEMETPASFATSFITAIKKYPFCNAFFYFA